MKILLVEDEKNIKYSKELFRKRKFEVSQAFDGMTALDKFNSENFNLIILDLMIPIIRGEEVMNIIRESSNIPIIILTSKTEEEDKISNFEIGCDDYITKPFSPKELILRVKALLRRSTLKSNINLNTLTFKNGSLVFNLDSKIVKLNNKNINLTLAEYNILLTLFKNTNKVFTREELINLVFDEDFDSFDRAIDTHIKNIRSKLNDNPKSPKFIKTVYGLGYKAVD